MKTRPLILLLLVLYIFSPTLFNWVINPNGAWYRPYIIWVIVIVIAYILQERTRPNDF
ncbi:hypothetical protein ACXYTJ_08935 [Gilvimarinus sp. F26214L]|uniref:hypothetical protein n=1 Tax=Gilvimarinus sp. DZF01 TaxID=3461371 RepID=UPI004046024D